MNKLAVTGLLAVSAVTRVFATVFGPETDMATLNDYSYYVTNPSEGRAVHSPNAVGWYSLGADRVWSSLCLSPTYLSADTTPVCFDLGGHTLTVTGCDTDYHPFSVSAGGVTCILSNGTISAVHDETTYPKTNGKYATAVSVQKGSTLIIEKDATLVHDAGTATLAFSGNDNKVIVRDGGTVNAKFARSGVNNRWIFEKGAKWPAISNYINSNGTFPHNIWYESGDTSNLFEICSSDFLTQYGITAFNVAAHEKAGSYHCGMVLRSSDFDFSIGSLTVGDGSAPVLFEVRDGAKLTLGGELWIVHSAAGSGSVMNIDGPGTVVKQTKAWGGRIGTQDAGTAFDPDSTAGYTHGLLRVSNGANFDLSQNSAAYSVGYGRNCNYNALEILSGSCITSGCITVGLGNNCGNTFKIDGVGSVANVTYVNVGRSSPEGGGGHQVIVSNGGKLIHRSSGLYLGEASTNCLLDVDGGSVELSGDLTIGATNALGVSYAGNCLNVKNGSLTMTSQFLLRSKDSRIVVSNGTITARQFHFPQSGYADATGVELTLAGPSTHLLAKDWGVQVYHDTKVRFVVPKNGYVNAPLDASAGAYVGLFDGSTVEIDATEFLESDGDVCETLLVDSHSEIQGRAMFAAATITPNDGRAVLKWSADKKRLYLRRRRGLLFVVR